MIVQPLAIPDVMEIIPDRHPDDRGYFSEVWNAATFKEKGIDTRFVQDNQSLSAERGVLRGLHYQIPPFAQVKLLRVLRGSIFDVAVDIRRDSPGFGRWVGLTLSAEAGNQILVPIGFAHGFVTLEPGCEILYKVSAPYSPRHERTIRFDDPDIAIDWPVPVEQLSLKEGDRTAPPLAAADLAFRYGA
ncbi:MAG TPA: dTDP-4-dehydrorhamnose 3,5-epimerase [Allosphingosinicella sp.]|nr:dTDP-4-dehydrorhamnose 3,5-epimerase [Allosphingosinicella sp.]